MKLSFIKSRFFWEEFNVGCQSLLMHHKSCMHVAPIVWSKIGTKRKSSRLFFNSKILFFLSFSLHCSVFGFFCVLVFLWVFFWGGVWFTSTCMLFLGLFVCFQFFLILLICAKDEDEVDVIYTYVSSLYEYLLHSVDSASQWNARFQIAVKISKNEQFSAHDLIIPVPVCDTANGRFITQMT